MGEQGNQRRSQAIRHARAKKTAFPRGLESQPEATADSTKGEPRKLPRYLEQLLTTGKRQLSAQEWNHAFRHSCSMQIALSSPHLHVASGEKPSPHHTEHHRGRCPPSRHPEKDWDNDDAQGTTGTVRPRAKSPKPRKSSRDELEPVSKISRPSSGSHHLSTPPG